jgi:hypothetical protein
MTVSSIMMVALMVVVAQWQRQHWQWQQWTTIGGKSGRRQERQRLHDGKR